MGKIRLLIPDLLSSPSALALASSEASASLGDDNLLTAELWQKWRSTSVHPGKTRAVGYINGFPLLPINGLALAGLNMLPGNGDVLPVLSTANLGSLPHVAVVPSAIAASSLITGAVGDVNEPLDGASDAAFVKPTAASGSFVLFDFGTPAASPRTGARRQCFALKVQASGDTTGALAYGRPTVTVKLYEDVLGTPTLRETLGTKAVHGTASHLLFFPWDASALATADGSNVQARVEFTQNGSGPDAWLDAIEWQCESTQLTAAGGYVADAGWVQILAEPLSGLGYDYPSQLAASNSRWSYKFDQTYQASRASFFLRDDHVPYEGATSLNRLFMRPPPGYVEAGKIIAGVWWEPAINRAQGAFATSVDRSSVVEDDDGGRWGIRREALDEFRIVLDSVTEQEMAWLKLRIFRELGVLSPFYLELEPDATFELGFGGWVTLTSTSNVITRRNTNRYTYSMEFTVRSKR